MTGSERDSAARRASLPEFLSRYPLDEEGATESVTPPASNGRGANKRALGQVWSLPPQAVVEEVAERTPTGKHAAGHSGPHTLPDGSVLKADIVAEAPTEDAKPGKDARQAGSGGSQAKPSDAGKPAGAAGSAGSAKSSGPAGSSSPARPKAAQQQGPAGQGSTERAGSAQLSGGYQQPGGGQSGQAQQPGPTQQPGSGRRSGSAQQLGSAQQVGSAQPVGSEPGRASRSGAASQVAPTSGTAAQSGPAQPASSQPGSNQPGANQSAQGQSAQGQPAPHQSAQGQAAQGQAGPGQQAASGYPAAQGQLPSPPNPGPSDGQPSRPGQSPYAGPSSQSGQLSHTSQLTPSGPPHPPGGQQEPPRQPGAQAHPQDSLPAAQSYPPALGADGLDAVALHRDQRPVPQSGWRKAVYVASGRRINPGESPADRHRRELISRVNQPLRGCYKVAMVSLKGGVGKTTTTTALGSTFASLRGDRVIAVDANPDRGTLNQKIPQETAATVRQLLRDAGGVTKYSDVRSYTSQGPSRLEVLASDQDPAVSEAYSEQDYRRTVDLLEHFYNIVLTDCGTGLMHSAMRGVLALTDSLVLVSSATVDGARSALATLDWLDAHGYGGLVASSVAVINSMGSKRAAVDFDKLLDHFGARCRAVCRVPFDPHLEQGTEVDLDRLTSGTRLALLELAATVADGFPSGFGQPR